MFDVFSRQQKQNSLSFKRANQFSLSTVQRLGFWKELHGHTGCINCIEWDQTGRLLYSGSDDLSVIIWNVASGRTKHNILTSHSGNIFSVKAAPKTNGGVILSGAADGRICINDVTSRTSIKRLHGPENRIKELAVSEDDPYMVWSGSEDGTVWEYDIRCEESSRVLINLKYYSSWSVNSTNPVKCLAINPVRSEQIAIGSMGPFVRLFDRRMINPCTNWEFPHIRESIPIEAEQVFCPGHLGFAQPRSRGSSNLSVSRIAFSADGRDMLANIGGEQIYLFNIYSERCSARYCLPKSNQLTHSDQQSSLEENNSCKKFKSSSGNDKRNVSSDPVDLMFEKLITLANNHFSGCRYFEAINEYNKAFQAWPCSLVVLSNRAAALLKRSWRGDTYEALRDCLKALAMEPYLCVGQPYNPRIKAYFRIIKCLYELRWIQEARLVMDLFRSRFPMIARSRICENLHCDILACVDTSPVTFSSPAVDIDHNQCIDYEQRFTGHCNTTTDIKNVTFLDDRGKYLAAGSDDGCLFIWDRYSTNIVKILNADDSIVNCIQANPVSDVLATSGIDSVVRLWHPTINNDRVVDDIVETCVSNQRRMSIGPVELMLLNMGFDQLSDASESAMEGEELRIIHPRIFQCEQS